MDRREENEMTKKLYSLLFLAMAVLLLSNCSPDTVSSAPHDIHVLNILGNEQREGVIDL